MKTRLTLVSMLSLMVALLMPGTAFGSEFKSIVCPGEQETSASSINTNGTVVGSCLISGTTAGQAYVWRNGILKLLVVPHSKGGATALDINDSEVVAGVYYDEHLFRHGFIVEAGLVSTFDVPGASYTTPAAINSSGVIVGSCVAGNVTEGFIRDAQGNFTTFALPGYAAGASAINASGVITGIATDTTGMSHGFVRDAPGNVTIFDPPGVGIWGTQSLAINASGQITGYWYDPNAIIHGFLRDASGNFSSFDAPHAGTTTVFTGTFAQSINDSGVITGYALTDTNIELAFVKSGSDSPVSFEDPLASITADYGTRANKINSLGRIVGQYSYPGGFEGFYRDVLPPSSQRKLNSN